MIIRCSYFFDRNLIPFGDDAASDGAPNSEGRAVNELSGSWLFLGRQQPMPFCVDLSRLYLLGAVVCRAAARPLCFAIGHTAAGAGSIRAS
jgi:hypothetical protein